MQVDQSRLHHCAQVFIIDFEDTIHTSEHDHNAAIDGDRAAAQSCASTTRNDRPLETSCDLHDSRNLFGTGWQDHHIRSAAINGGVIFIQREIVGRVQDVLSS